VKPADHKKPTIDAQIYFGRISCLLYASQVSLAKKTCQTNDLWQVIVATMTRLAKMNMVESISLLTADGGFYRLNVKPNLI